MIKKLDLFIPFITLKLKKKILSSDNLDNFLN